MQWKSECIAFQWDARRAVLEPPNRKLRVFLDANRILEAAAEVELPVRMALQVTELQYCGWIPLQCRAVPCSHCGTAVHYSAATPSGPMQDYPTHSR